MFNVTVQSLAATTLGHPSRRPQNWFDKNEEIKSLLKKKHHLHKVHQDDTSSVSKICKTVQNRLMNNTRLLAEQLIRSNPVFSDSKNIIEFHDALKMVKTPMSSGATPLLSADGSTLLTKKMLSWKG